MIARFGVCFLGQVQVFNTLRVHAIKDAESHLELKPKAQDVFVMKLKRNDYKALRING